MNTATEPSGFVIPADMLPAAARLYKQAWHCANQHGDALADWVIRDLALAQVALWSTFQDGEATARRASVIAQAAELVIRRANFVRVD